MSKWKRKLARAKRSKGCQCWECLRSDGITPSRSSKAFPYRTDSTSKVHNTGKPS